MGNYTKNDSGRDTVLPSNAHPVRDEEVEDDEENRAASTMNDTMTSEPTNFEMGGATKAQDEAEE